MSVDISRAAEQTREDRRRLVPLEVFPASLYDRPALNPAPRDTQLCAGEGRCCTETSGLHPWNCLMQVGITLSLSIIPLGAAATREGPDPLTGVYRWRWPFLHAWLMTTDQIMRGLWIVTYCGLWPGFCGNAPHAGSGAGMIRLRHWVFLSRSAKCGAFINPARNRCHSQTPLTGGGGGITLPWHRTIYIIPIILHMRSLAAVM